MNTPIEYASKALDYVLEHIKPTNSYNKRLPGHDSHHNTIGSRLFEMRNEFDIKNYQKDTFIDAGLISLEWGIGNCTENACAALAYLENECGYHDVDIVVLKNIDHTFVVVGASLQKTYPDPAEALQQRYPDAFEAWHPNVAICDPWAEIATLAINYPEKWRAQMRNWRTMNMQLYLSYSRIYPPTGPYWYNAPGEKKLSNLR